MPDAPIARRSAEPDGHDFGTVWLHCNTCAADWVGYPEDECAYCAARVIRMDAERRKELLWPPWAANGNSSRYDQLDEIGKQVWRTTRGQKTDADSIIVWVKELSAAVAEGLITPADAEAAIKRIGEHEDG